MGGPRQPPLIHDKSSRDRGEGADDGSPANRAPGGETARKPGADACRTETARALQRQAPHTMQRGVPRRQEVTRVGDLEAWANCNTVLRRIERIVEVTGCAEEPVGRATKWYLDYQSHRATGLGPKARRERLEELMWENRSRAACMLTWHQKWTVLAELVEVTGLMYPTAGHRTSGSQWPPTPEHREHCRWKVEQSTQETTRLEGGASPWTIPFGGKHSKWTTQWERTSTGPVGNKCARITGSAASGSAAQAPPSARICAMLTDISHRKGVPGVTYQPLPRKSMYLDPGHVLTADCDEPVWMKDSGAGVPGFNHPYGLGPITDLDRPIVIGGIVSAANVTVTKGAMLDNVQVLYDPSFGANCLAVSTIVDAGWEVLYHKPTDSYVVTTASKCRLCFQRYVMANGAVTTHYLCHPRLPYSGPSARDVTTYAATVRSSTKATSDASATPLGATSAATYATSVQGNLSMHSVQDAKAAAQAMRYLTNMGGSVAHGIARLPELRGVNITADNVRKAVDIYGPVRSHVQGSATSVQDVAVTTELPSARPSPVPQALAVDL